MSFRFGLIFIVFYVEFAHSATSKQYYHFGLTSTKSQINFNLNAHSPTLICASLGLNAMQRQICSKDKEIAKTLAKAMSISVKECDHQFHLEKWNCSIGPTRTRIINKGCKEASFLFAVTSASLVHTIARACKTGKLDRCSCGLRINPKNRGCGDNIEYAKNFTRRFFRTTGKRGRLDARAEVDIHNLNVGIRVVTSSVKEICRCPALKENCEAKTCVYKLANFRHIGNVLKLYYQNATKHITTNRAGDEIKPPKNKGRNRNRNKNKKRKNKRQKLGENAKNATTTRSKKRHLGLVGRNQTKTKAGLKKRHSHQNSKRKISNMKKLPKTKLDVNKMSLKFFKKSPNFCVKSKYSEGVSGRELKDEVTSSHVCCRKYVRCCKTPDSCDCFRCV